MNTLDTVNAFCAAMERGDLDAASALLAETFHLTTGNAPPLGKAAFLAVQRAQRVALPDLSFHWEQLRAEPNLVRMRMTRTGTHLGVLAFPLPGLPRVEPTGRAVTLPAEEFEFVVEGGRITEARGYVPPNGGPAALFAAVGVALPKH